MVLKFLMEILVNVGEEKALKESGSTQELMK
jgi:hypothetical protein